MGDLRGRGTGAPAVYRVYLETGAGVAGNADFLGAPRAHARSHRLPWVAGGGLDLDPAVAAASFSGFNAAGALTTPLREAACHGLADAQAALGYSVTGGRAGPASAVPRTRPELSRTTSWR